MLILPLHRPLTVATFPFVTALLLLANVFVFFAFQTGNDAAFESAQRHYVQSGLGDIETPAYQEYLQRNHRSDDLSGMRAVPERLRPGWVAQNTVTDGRFAHALDSGELFDSPQQLQQWRRLRADYDRQLDGIVTLRYLLRSSEVDPLRMFTSMFLHGDVLHLLGNMIFLVALGLLVEGAMGSVRFTGVYLLGGLAANAVSLWWRWGEAGGGLGASGAIAALMGAFCVVWGRQPVRFFFWIGVVFDYLRAPAIWLLPLWLGWEVFNLLGNGGEGIAFEAHAGGIVAGALIGGALVALGQVRQEFIRMEELAAVKDSRWEDAQACLGRLQLAQAESLLNELALENPERFEVRLALYRVARNGHSSAVWRERAGELLALSAPDREAADHQYEALVELQSSDVESGSVAGEQGGLDPVQRQRLLSRWIALGRLSLVEQALAAQSAVRLPPGSGKTGAGGIGADDGDGHRARLWFELALAYGRRQREARQRVLQRILAEHPGHAYADKARFLLEND